MKEAMQEKLNEQTETYDSSSASSSYVAKRDWPGSLVGLAIVVGGMAILYTVFKEAWNMFAVPPAIALNVLPNKSIDLPNAFNATIGIFVKIVLLLIMAWLGSVITNRGIYLYGMSKPGRKS